MTDRQCFYLLGCHMVVFMWIFYPANGNSIMVVLWFSHWLSYVWFMIVLCLIYGCLNCYLMSSWASDSCLSNGCLNVCFKIYLWLSRWLSYLWCMLVLCSISGCVNCYLMCDICIWFVFHMSLSSLILLRLGLYLGEHLLILCTLYVCTPQVSLN